MLDLKLFRNPTFTGANIEALGIMLGLFGVFFFLSPYTQQCLGYGLTKAGASFLPMTVLITFVAPLAGRMVDKVGARWLMAGGLTLLSCSLMVFSRLDTGSG